MNIKDNDKYLRISWDEAATAVDLLTALEIVIARGFADYMLELPERDWPANLVIMEVDKVEKQIFFY